jgi:UDP-3-O-[3-hydroxymyristoyl] N-acetylglucosamine deacetylase
MLIFPDDLRYGRCGTRVASVSPGLMELQYTVEKPVELKGVGLHSGEPARIAVRPAAANSGIVFRVPGHTAPIPAQVRSVVDSHYATTLGVNGTRIRTVEHLMAAVGGLAIDNLAIEVEGGEIPAADGSAQPFVALLRSAGRAALPARRDSIIVTEPIRVESGSRWIEVVPDETFRISYTLDHSHPAVGTQVVSCALTEDVFADEVAPARTYAFLKDVARLREHGLARGGWLDNTIVLGEAGALNELRFSDEFVRHKILDLIGDLRLLRHRLVGHVRACNGGHALNVALAAAIENALEGGRRAVQDRGQTLAARSPVFAARGVATL